MARSSAMPAPRKGRQAAADADARHACAAGARFALHDARGIFAGYACPACAKEKRAQFRADVWTDPGYAHDEPLDD